MAARNSRDDPTRAYYMPTVADVPIVAMRSWISKHSDAQTLAPLPPRRFTRQQLFDRWSQHTEHCVICQQGIESIRRWRRNTLAALAIAIWSSRWTPARVLAIVCICLLPLLNWFEGQFKFVDYKHYRT